MEIELIDVCDLPPHLIPKPRRPYRRRAPPKPPPRPRLHTIQDWLRTAYRVRKRLKEQPALTHEVLAQEERIEVLQLKQALSLLSLAPQIQHSLLLLDPPLAESSAFRKGLLKLVAITDREAQVADYEDLLAGPGMSPS
ncbi:MAG: hypothetical protein WC443_10815 [Desulfobaccales bacterium]